MACGTPVIAARAGALPEVVGSVGLLVDPQRVEEIRDAMACCLSDADQLHQASVDGPRRAAGFRWSETARHVGELLENLA
jgi:glycosyltransferase involved in cell wall biosynthesis